MPDAPTPASSPVPVELPFDITKTALGVQALAQVRIWIAGVAGALVVAAANRLHLPILTALWGSQGDQVVGIIVGGIMLAAAAGWQWARVRLVNSRFWRLAIDPEVPDSKVRVAPSATYPGQRPAKTRPSRRTRSRRRTSTVERTWPRRDRARLRS